MISHSLTPVCSKDGAPVSLSMFYAVSAWQGTPTTGLLGPSFLGAENPCLGVWMVLRFGFAGHELTGWDPGNTLLGGRAQTGPWCYLVAE